MSERLPLFCVLSWCQEMVNIGAKRIRGDALIVESTLILKSARSTLGRVAWFLERRGNTDTLTYGIP